MTRRTFAVAVAAAFAVFSTSSLPVSAQTKPRIAVPATSHSQARAIVDQLLRQGKIMRASDVHRGMRGVARSVFQGTKITEFPVEVLGVLSRVQGGGDLVLIKILGGPVVQRQSGIIAGMSGSPVYFNGKMLGAIAIGWGFPKEPIGGVTPITQMIESSLPDPDRAHLARPLPPKAGEANSQAYRPRTSLKVAGHKIARLVISRDPRRLALSGPRSGSTMTMRPVSTLLQLSGFSTASLPLLRHAFTRYGIEPVIGPSSRVKTKIKPAFIPGSSIGVQLVSGDMDQTAVGTVTFRWGKRILAFGHPMFGQGATSLPMTTSYVHDIFPSYQRSFKLASAIDVIGALQQDTEFAIGGTVGAVADTIPMSINVRDPERQINKTYHVRVIKDPVLTPTLLAAVASEAISTSVGQTSDKMLRIGMRMQIDGAQPIVKHNYIYSPGDISDAALADLGQSLAITQQNEFARGSIHRIDLTVALESVRKTARIKSMFADRNKVKAGESVTINVVLEEVDNPNKTSIKSFTFAVPADAPTGVMRIAAGAASSYYPLRMKVGAPAPDPTNLNELIAAYMRMGGRNELEVQASTPDTYLLIDRKKVSDPAPSWTRLLKNSASTSVGSYNEVSELRETTDYSLSGSLTISIPVESLKDRDKLSPNGDAVAAVATAVETSDGDDNKPAMSIDDANGDDAADGGDDDENANIRARRLERLFTTSKFLNNLKLWQRLAAAPPAARQEAPARLPGDRPITPTITSPTPTPAPKPTPAPTPVPTPIALPLDKGKGLGRPALSWVQASPTEFLRGTFLRAQVGSEGTIRLSPPTRMLATTTENFAWSVAGDKAGNSYLGTGNQARILKIDATGHVSTLYDGPEVAVTALCTDAAGNLYAGVSPGGRVYRFAPDGKKTEIFNCDQTFIWALAWDRTGNLLIGTGGANGRLYRIHINPSLGSEVVGVAATGSNGAATPIQAQIAPFAVFAQKHVRAIAVRDNEIYVGTADDGVLYRVDGTTGATTALYQVVPAAQAAGAGSITMPATLPISLAALLGAPSAVTTKATGEITSVVAAKDGIYFGTLNSGTIYRCTEEGGTVALYPSPQKSVYALALGSDGKLFAATGDKGVVYQIEPAANPGDVHGARVLEPTQLQSITLGITPSGNLLVGTGNNAAIYSIDLAANSPEANSGTYTSAILDAHNTVRWGALRTMGNADFETRSGNTLQPDTTWSPWQPAARNDLGELRIASPAARYLQYRAQLTAHQGAVQPSLSRVEIVYRATNMPPTVAFSAPRGGEYWNKQKKLSWLAVDPNADPLAYRLWLSADDGKSWDSQPLLNDKLPTFDLDTSKLKDGIYRAKVEASDAGRNPEDPMSDVAIAAPFVIDNTPPVVAEGTAHRNADGSINIAATATDALSPLISAEWRLTPAKPETATPAAATATSATPTGKTPVTQGKVAARKAASATPKTATAVAIPGTPAVAAPAVPTPLQTLLTDGWNAAGTADSIFDSRRESIVATVSADKAAAAAGRTIELRVRDAADNITVITLTVA